MFAKNILRIARIVLSDKSGAMIESSHTLANEFSVGHLHIGLVDHRVLEGGVKTLMTEQVLHLLDGHTFVDSHCRQCPSELMWMHLGHIQVFTYVP